MSTKLSTLALNLGNGRRLEVDIYAQSDPLEIAEWVVNQFDKQPRWDQYETVYLKIYDMVVKVQAEAAKAKAEAEAKAARDAQESDAKAARDALGLAPGLAPPARARARANSAPPATPAVGGPLEKAMQKQHEALPEPSRSILREKPSEKPSERRQPPDRTKPAVDGKRPKHWTNPQTEQKVRLWVLHWSWEERPIGTDEEWTEKKRKVQRGGFIRELMTSIRQEIERERKGEHFETQNMGIQKMYYLHPTPSGRPLLIDQLNARWKSRHPKTRGPRNEGGGKDKTTTALWLSCATRGSTVVDPRSPLLTIPWRTTAIPLLQGWHVPAFPKVMSWTWGVTGCTRGWEWKRTLSFQSSVT